MAKNSPLASSYKDPSGFVFKHEGIYYRHVAPRYSSDYDTLMKSGLYKKLTDKGWLIPHTDLTGKVVSSGAYKVLKPTQIPFINYPYEWSFSQLKDAALMTLDMCLLGLEHGMILKDASAYNIMYHEGRPVFIDTLSYETYKEGAPWIAYGQFCRHFLAPLTVSAYKDLRFIPLLRQFLDGFPLDLVSNLLPKKTLLNMGLAMHLHAHAKAQGQLGGKKIGAAKTARISKFQLTGLLRGLRGTIEGIKLPKAKTQWGEYYSDHNYSESGFKHKQEVIAQIVKKHKVGTLLDIGANNGEFSRFAGKHASLVISTDVDPNAVEQNYQIVKKEKEANILPLYLDITNPSGGVGFALQERSSFFQRGNVDSVMALALIHHLAITFNLSFDLVARFFAHVSPTLIIEFVPKSDSQVVRLLQNREDIFDNYTEENFEKEFGKHFTILEKILVKDSLRNIYVMKAK